MPYIKPERRETIALAYDPPQTSGELNYKFTVLVEEYLATHGLCYQTINDIIGAMDCAHLEFYRRVVVPYEDQKIIENGDVGYERYCKRS